MNKTDPIVITSAVRTPIGHLQGALKGLSATDLGATVIKAAVEKSQVHANAIESVIMGCVLPAGLGQAPARQAALKAGLAKTTDCTTVNKVCGSAMKAIMFAFDALQTNPEAIIIAGGMESMTNAPFLLPHARQGYRLGHQQLVDHMMYDGLEDAYEKGSLMGIFAEKCASELKFDRKSQDDFALASLEKATYATQNKLFQDEIVPIVLTAKNGQTEIIATDDGPKTAKPEKIPTLKAAFAENGTITAANASSISDGAAAVTLMHHSKATHLGIRPLVKIVGHASYSCEPSQFTTAPIHAVKRLMQKIDWQITDVDLWEINEAFAVVTMATMQGLNLARDRVNIHGGACVLGHPIGASGARIVVTLIHSMLHRQAKRGVATLCIGGGEATALAIELI